MTQASNNQNDHVRGPGELAWASVMNPFENRASVGKSRPVVLVERVDGHWRTMGLTTNSTYRDGTPRRPIPSVNAVGLSGPGFLWGEQLTNVSSLDIGDHIGWADEALVEAIIAAAELSGEVAEALRQSALCHGRNRGATGKVSP